MNKGKSRPVWTSKKKLQCCVLFCINERLQKQWKQHIFRITLLISSEMTWVGRVALFPIFPLNPFWSLVTASSTPGCSTHSHLVVKVAQAAVALCSTVELCNLWDIEAVHELLPYGLTQAVAQCHAHLMLPLGVANWLVQQVPADLADVLHNLVDRSEKKKTT